MESNLPPSTSYLQDRGAVAQLGERRLCKAEVGGSSPPGSTNQGDWAGKGQKHLGKSVNKQIANKQGLMLTNGRPHQAGRSV